MPQPVQVLRDPQSLQSSLARLYPTGEGAGHAGGMSVCPSVCMSLCLSVCLSLCLCSLLSCVTMSSQRTPGIVSAAVDGCRVGARIVEELLGPHHSLGLSAKALALLRRSAQPTADYD